MSITQVKPNRARQIRLLLWAQWRAQWRGRQVLTASILYVLMLVLVVYTALKNPDFGAWIALFWLTQIFVILNFIARAFDNASRGATHFFYFLVPPEVYIATHIIYNTLACLALSLLNIFCFYVFFGALPLAVFPFFLSVIAGAIGFSALFTFVSAIARDTDNSFTTVSILSLPLFVPHVSILLRLSEHIHQNADANYLYLLSLLFALDILIILISLVLFKYLWKNG